MLADPASVEEVALGKGELIQGLKSGSIYIDMTTVSPETSRKLGKAAAGKGIAFLDAPVTGSKPAAASGELVPMVGGDAATLERAPPVLRPISKKIVHMGAVGTGSLMKLVNNLLMAGAMAAFFEGFVLGKRGGLTEARILEVLLSGALSSPLLKLKGEAILKRDFEPLFSLRHMAKDIHLAVEEAKRGKLEAPITQLLNERFAEAKKRGWSDVDDAALIQLYPLNDPKENREI